MVIRDEVIGDFAGIRKVVEVVFARSLEAELVDELRASGDSVISLVAVDDDKIVGHVMFSNMTAPFRALGLAPVSVMPDRQRSGIGSLLVRAGLERAELDGWEGVFVLGAPGYYQRFGFSVAGARGFTSRYGGAHFMLIRLNGGRVVSEGEVNYAPAFAALG